MIEAFDNMEAPNAFDSMGIPGDIDIEVSEKQQREEIARQDTLRIKATEEADKKKERINKGRQEFEEALK